MEKTKNCECCGSEFSVYPSEFISRKFCSPKCYHKTTIGQTTSNKGKRKYPISKEKLSELYYVKKMTLQQIANMLGYLSGVSIMRIMTEYGMKRRKKGTDVPWNKNKQMPSVSLKMKLSNPMKNQESLEKMKKTIRKQYEDGRIPHNKNKIGWTNSTSFRNGHDALKKWRDGTYRKPTKPERQLDEILQTNFPNEWKYVGDGRFWVEGFNPDFINVNGKKQIIEMFGIYWHEINDEAQRKAIMKKYGYSTLVVWEDELKNKSKVIEKIEKWEI